MYLTEGIFVLKNKLYTNNDIISLDELKKSIYRQDPSLAPTITDAEILRYRDSAVSKIEILINTSIIASDYELYLPTYANNSMYKMLRSAGFAILKPFIKNITSIEYLKDGVYTLLDTNLYQSQFTKFEGCILFKRQEELPSHDLFGNNLNQKAVRTTFKSGLFDSATLIDSTIINAIVSFVIEGYNGCDEVSLVNKLKSDISEYIYIKTGL